MRCGNAPPRLDRARAGLPHSRAGRRTCRTGSDRRESRFSAGPGAFRLASSTSRRIAAEAPPGWRDSHSQWRGSKVTSRAATPRLGRPRGRRRRRRRGGGVPIIEVDDPAAAVLEHPQGAEVGGIKPLQLASRPLRARPAPRSCRPERRLPAPSSRSFGALYTRIESWVNYIRVEYPSSRRKPGPRGDPPRLLVLRSRLSPG